MEHDLEVHYDDKGKFFAEHRVKEKIPVIIQTFLQKISGSLELPPSSNITDELNSIKGDFITIYDVMIHEENEQSNHETEILTLNRNQIIWVINNIEDKE